MQPATAFRFVAGAVCLRDVGVEPEHQAHAEDRDGGEHTAAESGRADCRRTERADHHRVDDAHHHPADFGEDDRAGEFQECRKFPEHV
jgi:hypothetical protein